MVDTRDLKSLGPKRPCGFDSRPRHEANELFREPNSSFAFFRGPVTLNEIACFEIGIKFFPGRII